jgi:TrmH family RNA methyltransferase
VTAPLTSLQNPRVKAVVRLRDRRHRDRAGQMLVEGQAELRLALEAGARPLALYVCRELAGEEGVDLVAQAERAGAEVVPVSRAVFEKLAYRENADGWLAVLPAVQRGLDDLALGAMPLVVVAESVEKPGNLGALLRSADAAGATAVIVCDPATDLGNPNTVRASRGTLFTVPIAEAATPEALRWLRARGLAVVAATPSARLPYTQADLRGPVALAVGAEDAGLSATWLEAADVQVRIPMQGRVNSLNVAASAALLLYEAVRQRARG